eukprot:2269540-Prymnesium_polylepis.2
MAWTTWSVYTALQVILQVLQVYACFGVTRGDFRRPLVGRDARAHTHTEKWAPSASAPPLTAAAALGQSLLVLAGCLPGAPILRAQRKTPHADEMRSARGEAEDANRAGAP